MYKVEYTDKARQDLQRLEPLIARRIVQKVDFYAAQESPLIFAKRLKGQLEGTYRFRVGDFRVVFWVDQNGYVKILNILRVKHRKDIYDL